MKKKTLVVATHGNPLVIQAYGLPEDLPIIYFTEHTKCLYFGILGGLYFQAKSNPSEIDLIRDKEKILHAFETRDNVIFTLPHSRQDEFLKIFGQHESIEVKEEKFGTDERNPQFLLYVRNKDRFLKYTEVKPEDMGFKGKVLSFILKIIPSLKPRLSPKPQIQRAPTSFWWFNETKKDTWPDLFMAALS